MISSYLIEQMSNLQNASTGHDWREERCNEENIVTTCSTDATIDSTDATIGSTDDVTTCQHSTKQIVKGDAASLYYARKQCRQFGFCIGDKVGVNPHPRLAIHAHK